MRAPSSGEILTEEIGDICGRMRRSLQGRTPARFLVAVSTGDEIAGVVGMRPPTQTMGAYARGERPIEMIHAFVARNLQRGGVGSALVAALEQESREGGHDEVLLNSGPRYATSGWGFFDRQPGYERQGVIRNLYGPGQDAPVWSKLL